MDVTKLLQGLPLFRGFDEGALRELVGASAVEETAAGARLLEYGTIGEFLGVLLEGEAAAERPAQDPAEPARELGRLAPGDHFGEMSLLTGELTGADIVARTTCRHLRIPAPVFARMLAGNPVAVGVLARKMAARLAQREKDPAAQRDAEDMWRKAEDPYGLRPEGALGGKRVLVVNCGSSSLKYRFFDGGRAAGDVRGLVERIGQASGGRHKRKAAGGDSTEDVAAPDHGAALRVVLRSVTKEGGGPLGSLRELDAIGHRVVHGGDRYRGATVIDDEVLATIRECATLAPLHNPPNLLGIEACRSAAPQVPEVAVFDTAFHQTVPPFAHLYAIPYDLYREAHLRRYGFHGPSHQYVSLRAATHLRRPIVELKMVTCHLGSGASVCAIDHGRSVDTSMGLTPLEGLVMGTRGGDIDPGLLMHLCTQRGMAPTDVEKMLSNESGLRGVSGVSNDMREIEEAAEKGNPRAALAVQMFAYRVKKYIGSYAAALGGLDVAVFTGGIGENAAGARARICQGLDRLGITIDEGRNRAPAAGREPAFEISAEGAPVKVLVVPTDEELMIARETVRALGNRDVTTIIQAREKKPIPIEVSAHHVHLSGADVERLFGAGHKLTPRSELSQPGQFACQEVVDLVGPKGRVDRVRVLGPERPETQVEISRTEEFKLGIDAPIRASGDIAGSPGLTLVGTVGQVTIAEGVICALRHVHMHPEDALTYGLHDRDVVRVRTQGERELIFGDVLIRVSPSFRLAMHIDTDEANAAELSTGAAGILDSIQDRQGPQRKTLTGVPMTAAR
ncbi:MAG: acetate/propionate family kinase [Deltaproteobacteria bacterium]|nr:acetate/propionate family kinase [Deltaproteobacteria bacterium]